MMDVTVTRKAKRVLVSVLFARGGIHLVTVPVDYSENMRVLVEELCAYGLGNREQS